MPIPTAFDRRLGEIKNMAESIHCRLAILENGRTRTTVGGDVMVRRSTDKAIADLGKLLQSYDAAVMSLAHAAGA